MTPSAHTRVWELPHDEAVQAIAERLTRTARRRISGTLYRATYDRFLHPPDGSPPTPLYHQGSLTGRRYTPRGGPAGLYLSFDPATPMAELRLVKLELGVAQEAQDHDPVMVVAVRAQTGRILDVTDDATRKILDLRDAELAVDWEHGQAEYLANRAAMPATQLLALAAHLTHELTGIKYNSVRTSFGTNVVIFPDRLAHGDYLEVIDSTGRLAQRLEG